MLHIIQKSSWLPDSLVNYCKVSLPLLRQQSKWTDIAAEANEKEYARSFLARSFLSDEGSSETTKENEEKPIAFRTSNAGAGQWTINSSFQIMQGFHTKSVQCSKEEGPKASEISMNEKGQGKSDKLSQKDRRELPHEDGEEIAREHLGPEEEPQIQRDTNFNVSSRTSGGAYGNRDDPRAQAAPPVEQKTNSQIVKEQTAGATGKTEQQSEDLENPDSNPFFAEKAKNAARNGRSSLGDQPDGVE